MQNNADYLTATQYSLNYFSKNCEYCKYYIFDNNISKAKCEKHPIVFWDSIKIQNEEGEVVVKNLSLPTPRRSPSFFQFSDTPRENEYKKSEKIQEEGCESFEKNKKVLVRFEKYLARMDDLKKEIDDLKNEIEAFFILYSKKNSESFKDELLPPFRNNIENFINNMKEEEK